MRLTPEDEALLQTWNARLKTILPQEYQECYEDVEPVSMGSAGLKYDSQGQVAWDEIWGSFCDLAMAGGPPHKGTLLEPASREAIDAQPDRYREVVAEICRGIRMVADLAVERSPIPGWVRVDCDREVTAGWLVRAIVMENVSAYADGPALYLPAGPAYRVEKEIKNVITVIAKTCHYFADHLWSGQQRDIADLFAKTETVCPFVQAAVPGLGFDAERHRALSGRMAEAIQQATGLARSEHEYAGWLGIQCPGVRTAVWMMRALVANNILSRRECTVLFVPVNPLTDETGGIVTRALIDTNRIAAFRVAEESRSQTVT
jgi:sirohydrochlorin cobaltochelatase